MRELAGQLEVSRLPAREEQIRAQDAQVAAARAAVEPVGVEARPEARGRDAGRAGRRHAVSRGRMGAGGQPRRAPAAAAEREGALLRSGDRSPAACKPGRNVILRCDGCGADVPAAVSYVADRARVHAADHLQQRDAREAGVHGRGAPDAGQCAAAASGPARRRDAAMSARRLADAIDVHGLNKHFGDKHVVNDLSLQVEARRDLRLPRPQRQRQDHLDPPDVRPAHARLGLRHLPRLRHPQAERARSSATSAT